MGAVPIKICYYLTVGGRIISVDDRVRITTSPDEVPAIIVNQSSIEYDSKIFLPIRATLEPCENGRLYVYIHCVEDKGETERDQFKRFIASIKPEDFKNV